MKCNETKDCTPNPCDSFDGAYGDSCLGCSGGVCKKWHHAKPQTSSSRRAEVYEDSSGSCKTNVECPSYGTCLNGKCQLRKCKKDSMCERGFYCSKKGECMANEECDSSNDCPKIQKCVQVHGVCRYGSKKCKNNQECIHPDICREGKCVDEGVHPNLSTSSESGKAVKPEPKPSMNDEYVD